MSRLQRERPVAVALATLGFTVTMVSIVLALTPAEDESNKL